MAVDPVFGTAISGVASLIGSIGSKRRAKRNVAASVKATKELADYTYAQDLEQWNRANTYNMPRAQMDRLRDANLNPNLVYGTGTVTGNTAQPGSPSYQKQVADYSQVPAVQPPNLISQYQDVLMKNAQIDLVRSQASTEQAEADNAELFYWSRAGKTFFQKQLGKQFHRFGQSFQAGDKENRYFRGFETQLQGRQAQTRQYRMGADLKAIELEFANWMKGTQIGARAFPFLRLLFNKR